MCGLLLAQPPTGQTLHLESGVIGPGAFAILLSSPRTSNYRTSNAETFAFRPDLAGSGPGRSRPHLHRLTLGRNARFNDTLGKTTCASWSLSHASVVAPSTGPSMWKRIASFAVTPGVPITGIRPKRCEQAEHPVLADDRTADHDALRHDRLDLCARGRRITHGNANTIWRLRCE